MLGVLGDSADVSLCALPLQALQQASPRLAAPKEAPHSPPLSSWSTDPTSSQHVNIGTL